MPWEIILKEPAHMFSSCPVCWLAGRKCKDPKDGWLLTLSGILVLGLVVLGVVLLTQV